MTLKSPSKINEVGSKSLHDKHTVLLEKSDSAFFRGRVADQRFIDYLLMMDVISMDQHRSGDRLLGYALSASIFLTSPKFTGTGGGSGVSNTDIYSSGLMKWHREEKKIRKKWGDFGAEVAHDHIVLDVWTKNEERVALLTRILA